MQQINATNTSKKYMQQIYESMYENMHATIICNKRVQQLYAANACNKYSFVCPLKN